MVIHSFPRHEDPAACMVLLVLRVLQVLCRKVLSCDACTWTQAVSHSLQHPSHLLQLRWQCWSATENVIEGRRRKRTVGLEEKLGELWLASSYWEGWQEAGELEVEWADWYKVSPSSHHHSQQPWPGLTPTTPAASSYGCCRKQYPKQDLFGNPCFMQYVFPFDVSRLHSGQSFFLLRKHQKMQ